MQKSRLRFARYIRGSRAPDWWQHAREVRELYEFHQCAPDAKTLKRLHRYNERERQGLHPLLWHHRVMAFIIEPMRRLFHF